MGGGQVNFHSFPFRDIMESYVEILKRFKNYASFLILHTTWSVTNNYQVFRNTLLHFSASLQKTLICMM